MKRAEKPCQLSMAREVITRIGEGNVLYAAQRFWRRIDDSTWSQAHEREVKKIIIEVLAEHGAVTRADVNAVFDVLATEVFHQGLHASGVACNGGTIRGKFV